MKLFMIGTDLFGGVNNIGGGWVSDSNLEYAVDLCVFPDLSSIDAWGLLYHSVSVSIYYSFSLVSCAILLFSILVFTIHVLL